MTDTDLQARLDKALQDIYDLTVENKALRRQAAGLQIELAQAKAAVRRLQENDPMLGVMQNLALVEENDGRDPRNSGVFRAPWVDADGHRRPK